MFNADDEDQDFLSPTGGSKLASLFGVDRAANTGGNSSLTYTAPKQPKKTSDAASTGTNILKACVVHAFKLIDGSYNSQGKVGCAILSNHVTKDYKVLLYYSKQQQLTHARISSEFNIIIQPNNYISFYDEKRTNWSVMFDNAQNISEFLKQVALCKANCCHYEKLIVQDLTIGEGGNLERDDSVEVRYTGWLLSNYTFGDVFDSNQNSEKLFRFKIGKGKVIKGWEDGVVGMKKNGHRFLVIPASQAYGASGAGNRIPANAVLIFDVETVRVKLMKEKDSPLSSSTTSPAPPIQASPVITEDSDVDDFRSRSRTLSDHLSQSPTSDKAKLLSRMAKMGKSMLPSTAAPGSADDDEGNYLEQEQPEPAAQQRPRLPSKPTQIPNTQPQQVPQPMMQQPMVQQPLLQQPMMQQPISQPMMQQPISQPMMMQQPNIFSQATMSGMQPVGGSQLALYQSPQQFQQPFQTQNQQVPQFYQQQPPAPPQQPPTSSAVTTPTSGTDTHLPVLLSEARQQSTEVRISISKVTDKLDRISEKVDSLHTHTMAHTALQNNLPNMETAMLFQNLQRIIQDNDRLKKDLFEKSQKIENQNEKITDLLSRNQSYVEKNNKDLEDRHLSMNMSTAQTQTRLLQLEQEKVSLASQLADTTGQVSNLQLEIKDMKMKNLDVRQQLHDTLSSREGNNEDMTRLRLQVADYESKQLAKNQVLREEKQMRKTVESELSALKEEIVDLKNVNSQLDKNVTQKKNKSAEDKIRFEEEIEDLKNQHEVELESLRKKLKMHKTSKESAVSEQVSQMEEEINADWKIKYDKMVTSLEEKHSRLVRELDEEKQQLTQKHEEAEEKLTYMKTHRSDTIREVSDLQGQVDEFKLWKDKYDNLRGQASTMKKRYEDRIKQLIEQRDEAIEQRDEAVIKAEAAASAPPPPAPPPVVELDTEQLVNEVKKIMNTVFHQLRARFAADKSYTGAKITQVLLNTIREVTMKLVRGEDPATIPMPKEESEEEEDEEEEESEEEAEEEEEQRVEKETMRMRSKSDNKQNDHVHRNNVREDPVKENSNMTDTLSNGALSEEQIVVSRQDAAVAAAPSIPVSFVYDHGHSEGVNTPDVVESAPRELIPDVVVNPPENNAESGSIDQRVETHVDEEAETVSNQVEVPNELPEIVNISQNIGGAEGNIPDVTSSLDSNSMIDADENGDDDDDDEETTVLETAQSAIDSSIDLPDVTGSSSAVADVASDSEDDEATKQKEAALKAATEETLRQALKVPQVSTFADSDNEEPWREEPPEFPDLHEEEITVNTDSQPAPDVVSSNHIADSANEDDSTNKDAGASTSEERPRISSDPLFADVQFPGDKTKDNKETKQESKDVKSSKNLNDEEPLFGEIDNDSHDPFGVGLAVSKPESVKGKAKLAVKDEKRIKKATSDVDSDDGRPQPPPPPLFGDDDDDDDLDWLN